MSVESLLYAHLGGVRKEYPKTNLAALSFLIGVSNVYARISGLQVKGHVPSEGAVIFIANHTGITDALGMFYGGAHATIDENGEPTLGRAPRGVGKSTLFGVPESPKVRERTGKKGFLNSDHPLVNALVGFFIGGPLSGAGVIPIRRGMVDRAAIQEIETTLKVYQQPVGLFLMESRVKSGRVEGIKNGAAFIVQRNEDIPYCLVGISKNPKLVNIERPTTYAQLRRERGKLSIPELTMVLADGIVELLPPHIQEHWRLEGREREYQQLFGDRKLRVRDLTPP